MDIGRIAYEIRSCIICMAEFKFYSSVKNATGQFCSLQCKGKAFIKPRPIKTCLTCKITFEAPIGYKIKKFCSIECYGKSMQGIERPSFLKTETKEYKLNRLKKYFEKYVIRQEGCWDWKGHNTKKYGSLQYNGKSISAHRASWLIHYGEIPDGMFVCHKCDNPRCKNPEHLFLGTPTNNVHDMYKKGRNNSPRGEKSSNAKLTNQRAIEIKQMLKEKVPVVDIVQKFNSKPSTIYDIKDGKTWKHIIKN